MAFINAIQFCRPQQNLKVLINAIMYSHKHRKYVIDNRRNYMSFVGKSSDQKNLEERPKSCPNKCAKKKKPSFWDGMFSSKKKDKEKERVKPPIESCVLRQAKQKEQEKDDPDLSSFGGQPYRTCGSAYLIQKDKLPEYEYQIPKEDKILKVIEAPPQLKDKQDDPMPPFESVEQRLLELSHRKLHPFYKRYFTISKKPPLDVTRKQVYKSRSGPVCYDEIPPRLKYNKELLESKNMYSEYKRVHPPQDVCAKLIEMQKNEKATLERRLVYETLEKDRRPPKRKNVFESLDKDETSGSSCD